MTRTALLKRFNELADKWESMKPRELNSELEKIGISLLDLANAQAADIKDLVACLREITSEVKCGINISHPAMRLPMQKADALLERIGHE